MFQNLPGFIIAGVHKAGTTSLFYWLSNHPEVCCSEEKETNFFIYTKYGYPARPLSDYYIQWNKCKGEKLLMEASPGYFYGGKATAIEIKEKCNNPKILIVLRDPADRLISFFNRKKEMLFLPGTMSLSDYIKKCDSFSDADLVKEENHLYTGVVFGEYIKHINDWFEVFGDNLRIVFFDDLKQPKKFMQDLCEWIGVEKSFYETYNFNIENKSGGFKNKILHSIAVKASFGLQKFWRYNRGLKKTLKNIYYKMNRSAVKVNQQDSEVITQLRNRYKPFNAELGKFLESKGYSNLPKWITG